MKKLIFLLIIAVMTANLFSQSPQKMSYQCVVRNSSGALIINQSVGIKITILQGSSSGNAVYQETYSPNPQTNANGLVTVEIGGGVALSGTFSAINWASGIYFLKTETDPTGGTNYTISGTSQLLSVPYALHAKTAENGFSGNYNDLLNKPSLFSGSYNDLTNKPILFDGTWASLSGKPTFADVATSGTFASLLSKPTTLSGYGITDADGSITNELQALSLSGTQLTLSGGGGTVTLPSSGGGDNWGTQTVVTNNTLTGTGTASSPLTVANTIITPTWANIQSKPVFSTVATSGSYTDLTDKPTILGSQWTTSGSNIYYNSGNVGIGTSSPVTYIHAHGTPVTSRGQLSLSSPAEQDIFLSFYEADNFKAYLWYDDSDEDLRLQNFTAGDLNLNPYGGKVGIGTDIPGYTLDVSGNINFTGTLTQSGSPFASSWSNITGKPTTVSGYGITDAVTITGDQTIAGIKTFSSDIIVSGFTIGRGGNASLSNVAIGYNVLHSNTTGTANTAIGYGALAANTTGYYNTAIGSGALSQITTGINNTAIGANVLISNTTGNSNTAIGGGALLENTTGYSNTAIGINALASNTTGIDNATIGSGTLYFNTTGEKNTAIGCNAGRNVTGGFGNVFLGCQAGYWETGSNKLYIDNQARTNEADARVKSLIYGVFDANPANQILAINGNTGIGTTTPNYTLDVRGTIGNNTTLYHSDIRWKTDIQPMNYGIRELMRLNSVSYLWNADDYPEMGFDEGVQFGFIAQEFEKVIPELVKTDKDGYKSIDYVKLTPVLVEAIKEQQKQIDELKALVNSLIANQTAQEDK
jgi:hypothetical protein